MSAPAYMVASFELVDLPLLRCVAATGKPVILSTGMATAEEIGEAVDTLRLAGATQIALLKCTSAYPAVPEDMNLRAIPDLAARFGVPIGLSDHTMNTAVPVAAVTLGACIIEKHLTLSRSVPGPDSGFSLEPNEFREMVDAVRTAQVALGSAVYGPSEHERPALLFRRSLFVVRSVRAGEPFTHDNVRAIRPGNGLHTRHLGRIIGRVAAKDLQPGTPLQWHLIADDDAEDPLAHATS
jgi:N-acetylneuraminate synthase